MKCWCPDPDCAIPFGECHCGCGGMTAIGKNTRPKDGTVKGMPLRYLPGHHHVVNARMRRPVVRQPLEPFLRHIVLTKGLVSVVDAVLYDWLSQYNWAARFNREKNSVYAIRSERMNDKSVQVYMHREILGLSRDNPLFGDHANHDTLLNTGQNLRKATVKQNAYNCGTPTGKNRLRGAQKYGNRFKAHIRIDGIPTHIGSFGTEEEAHNAYCVKGRELRGEFFSP